MAAETEACACKTVKSPAQAGGSLVPKQKSKVSIFLLFFPVFFQLLSQCHTDYYIISSKNNNRTKLKQTEVDCEYLKRCCETLTEENRRLHKELQELKALKTTNPFHMQLPATTLTMCPSCERVATTTTNNETTQKTATLQATNRPWFFPLSQPAD